MAAWQKEHREVEQDVFRRGQALAGLKARERELISAISGGGGVR